MYKKLLSLILCSVCVLANSHVAGRSHKPVAHVARGDFHLGPVDVKLFSGTRWTWYAAGLGACGKTNTKHDSIVALNIAQFGNGYPGPHCFKKIVMNYNGKTKEAVITDMCPGCPYGGLDLTEGLFKYFDNLGKGVIHGEWHFKEEDEWEEEEQPTYHHHHHETSTHRTRSLGHTHDHTKGGLQQESSALEPLLPSSNFELPTSGSSTPSRTRYTDLPPATPTSHQSSSGTLDTIDALNQAFIGMARGVIAAGAN